MYKIQLSPYANIFYTEWLLDPTSSRYNLSIDQTLYGKLDVQALKRALKKYIAEHAILNSHIQDIDGKAHWVPNNSINELEYIESPVSIHELSNYVSSSFDLHHEPLYRFKLIRIKEGVYRFIVVMHHLIMDGSASLDPGVFEEVANYYNNENHTAKYSISNQIKLITDLTDSLSSKLEQNKQAHQEFWQKHLSDADNVDLRFLKLGSDYHKENALETNKPIGEIEFSYGEAEIAKLNQIKLKYGATSYVYGLSIFALLLHKYTGQERIAISYPVAIKDGLDFIYGAQINTSLILYQFEKAATTINLFNQIKEFFKVTIHNDIKHGYYPITDIIHDGGNKKLLDASFIQTYFRENPFKFNGITKVELNTGLSVDGVTKDLLLFEQDARNSKTKLSYRVRYDTRTINKELLENFVSTYKRLFLEILEDLVTENDSKPLANYSLLDQEQYHKIVYDWNKTERDYPRDKTIHQLLEEQVARTPNNIAVVYEDTRLTYQELNQKANQLAHYLINNYKIKPDDLIALCLDRSEQMLIAILGVLKAGGAYVPIDPSYPDERIRYVLNDTKAAVLIINEAYTNRILQLAKQKPELKNIDAVAIDSEAMQIRLAMQESINPITTTKSTDLVYVIYTSGTTGKPKGVMIEHKNMVNFISHVVQFLETQDVTMSYINYSFDAINAEIYPALLNGNLLHILNKESRGNLEVLYKYIIKNNITFIVLPAVVATEFSLNYNLSITKLRVIVVGGDTYRGKLGQIKIINQYGPTECTVCTTLRQYQKDDAYTVIGKPISNTTCYVLDDNLAVLPTGAIGELFISGDGLAKGYLNSSKLTKEKFITNPFQTKEEKSQNKNSRLYKTGDLVRWLPNGNLEFMGRNDEQVKIRGYRIELGEIENKLLSYPGIKQAAVIVQEKSNNKYLLAYYVADKKLDETKIHAYLSSKLPEYMLPQVLIYIDKLPLTANGKLDKKSLPEPELMNQSEYVAPRTELEKNICEIYAQVLNLPKGQIGIKHDFFRMGGNSLNASHAILEISSCFKINLGVEDLFIYPTVDALTKKINFVKQNKEKYSAPNVIVSTSLQRNYPLSYPQELIWWHQQTAPNIPFYNEPIIININDELNIKALEASINEIINRHEILRTNIIMQENEPRQCVRPFQLISIPYFDLRRLDKKKREKRSINIGTKYLKKIFDIEQDLLIRFTLVRLESKRYQLFIAAHHIIFDGVSIAHVLLKELEYLYKGFSINKLSSLPPLKLQYKDYSVWQKKLDLDPATSKPLAYWKKQLFDLQPLQLPTKQPRSKDISFYGKRQCLAFSQMLTQQLEKISTQEGVTLFMTLLASINILLAYYTNQEDIAVGTAVAGRNHAAIENMMGNFLNMVILRNKISSVLTFQQLLQQIKQTTIDAYSHQDLPFQELLKSINLPRINGSKLPFQVALIFEPNLETTSPAWSISQLEIHPGTSKFELMFELDKRSQGIIGRVEYNTDLYDDWFIKQMINHFQALLENLVKTPNIPIYKITALSPKECNKILINWNRTKVQYPAKTICELFEKQVKKNPNKLAVSLTNQKLTYIELNQKANKLANYLKKMSLQPGSLVAVCLERNIEAIICIIGILKAGAAYLPIDLQYPITRVKNILEDSKPPILLTSRSIYTNLQFNKVMHKINTIFLDQEWQRIEQENADNIPSCVTQDNLSYVIYTSGSTGKPKGILQTHSTIVNLIKWQAANEPYQQLNIAQFASFSFDVSLQEIFYALLNGHALHVISHETKKSISKLISFLQKNQINKLFIPPVVLGLIANEALHLNIRLPQLREIIVAGEALIISDEIREFFENNKQVRLINHYGPSETHVVTAFSLPKEPRQWDALVPIGKPIANTKVYILNKHLKPVPIGVIGELYFGGYGLARSYLNRPKLDEEKFIINPFSENKDERLYKTGDLAHWLPDGNIAFIGRIDNQVKIRGFRVELDEIEHCMLQHKSIRQCTIKVDKDQRNTKRLIAYIVYKNKPDPNSIKEYLKSKLPEYMVPSTFITLYQLPLNSSGKVDTDALPKPISDGNEHIPNQDTPATAEEKALIEIWANILKINANAISTTDNFFELGGHSLAALQLLTEIRKKLGAVLEPHELLRTPTIAEINLIIQKKPDDLLDSPKKYITDQASHLILLKEGKADAIPIFLIHPIGGTVFWYKNLSLYITCENPIYGLQDPCINAESKLFTNLAEMAEFYLNSIKQIQPQGPYLLGGASFGGTVAIEIAKQLKEQHEDVKHVILFDSWAVYPTDVQTRKVFEEGISKMHTSLVEKLTVKGILNLKPWLDLQWHRAQLLWNYKIPSISHNITLFKAQDPASYFMLQNHPSNYWQDYITTKIDVYSIPGDHETIFQSPNVEVLANNFDKVINRVVKMRAK